MRLKIYPLIKLSNINVLNGDSLAEEFIKVRRD